jgi:hypothetical protein
MAQNVDIKSFPLVILRAHNEQESDTHRGTPPVEILLAALSNIFYRNKPSTPSFFRLSVPRRGLAETKMHGSFAYSQLNRRNSFFQATARSPVSTHLSPVLMFRTDREIPPECPQ